MNGVVERKRDSPLHRGHESLVISEEQLLRKKVQAKTQALLMMSQELEQCRMQRDRYKVMAEDLKDDLDRRKKELDSQKHVSVKNHSDQDTIQTRTLQQDTKLLDLYIESREKNKCLRLQVDTLLLKLKEAEDDIKALRSKKEESKLMDQITPALHLREEMIEQMEKLHVKCRQLRLDLQSILDEKQELEMERDAFKCKAHRLNHELSQALNASKPVDVDALVNENRYLHERLKQLLEEKDLAQQSVHKYKSMLDSKRQKGAIKLGANSSVGSIMTFKQVEQLLQQGHNIPTNKTSAALKELHSLCAALLESLNDKNLALAHQKKANKILAARLCELDRVIQSPTVRLLEGYSNADVDIRCDSTSATSDISEERFDDKESDLQCDESLSDRNAKSKQSDASMVEQSLTNQLSIEVNADSNMLCKQAESSNTKEDPKNKQCIESKEQTTSAEALRQIVAEHSNFHLSSMSSIAIQDDECCGPSTPKVEQLHREPFENDIESNEASSAEGVEFDDTKSIGYRQYLFSRHKPFPIINFEETLHTCLPDELRAMVQEHLTELRAKATEESARQKNISFT